MVKIGNVSLCGYRPKIVLSLLERSNYKSLTKFRLKGVDIIELRIDRFKQFNPDYVIRQVKIIKRFGLPIIGTIRQKDEGGGASFGEDVRLEIFKAVIPLIDAVDIELFSRDNILRNVIEQAHKLGKIIILSYHNLKTTPHNRFLKYCISEAEKRDADIVKIACFAGKFTDVARLLALTIEHHKIIPLVTISLGKRGAISRIVFPLAGSLLTYTYLGRPFAVGQIPLVLLKSEMKRYLIG